MKKMLRKNAVVLLIVFGLTLVGTGAVLADCPSGIEADQCSGSCTIPDPYGGQGSPGNCSWSDAQGCHCS